MLDDEKNILPYDALIAESSLTQFMFLCASVESPIHMHSNVVCSQSLPDAPLSINVLLLWQYVFGAIDVRRSRPIRKPFIDKYLHFRVSSIYFSERALQSFTGIIRLYEVPQIIKSVNFNHKTTNVRATKLVLCLKKR